MRAVLAVAILMVAMALTMAKAFACSPTDTHAYFSPFFFGDGFDNTTCAATAGTQGCH
jgi:hypothetical protein